MPVSAATNQGIPSDAIERVDTDEDEIITMDPKNYYMIYLLQTSAFLHSSIAFLMMISYYKLKVSKHENFVYFEQKEFFYLGTVSYIQTRKRNSSKIRI
jgi:hypothetical protein